MPTIASRSAKSRFALLALPVICLAAAPSVNAATVTTKAKKVTAPAAGKPCTKAQVGTPVSSADGLLDCVANGKTFVWKKSPQAATTLAASAPAPTTVAGEKWPDKIIFAPVPSENAAAALAAWGPWVKGLEKALGIKVEQVSTSDYAGVIEGQLNNKIDLAMYGPFSYYLARQAGAKIDPIAVTVSQVGLPPSYQSFLITKAGSPINAIGDLRGKKVCFVDAASTSGYLYPYAGLKEAGIDPDKDLTPIFAGGHDRSVTAVKAGTCDAGFAFDDMVNITAVDRGLIKPEEIKVIWKSKAIPNSPMAVSTALPPGLVAKIKATVPKIDTLWLQRNGTCTEAATCNIGGANAWVAVNDSFFQPIADVCKATNAPACQPAKKN